jgi:hypothetical protein
MAAGNPRGIITFITPDMYISDLLKGSHSNASQKSWNVFFALMGACRDISTPSGSYFSGMTDQSCAAHSIQFADYHLSSILRFQRRFYGLSILRSRQVAP